MNEEQKTELEKEELKEERLKDAAGDRKCRSMAKATNRVIVAPFASLARSSWCGEFRKRF